MMDPDKIREQFSALLDGELTAEERAAVEAQLAQDSDLLRELEGFKRVDLLYRGLARQSAPSELEGRVCDALRPPVPRFAHKPLRRRVLWPLASAAALLIVGGVALYQFLPGPETKFEMANRAITADSMDSSPEARVPEAAPEPSPPADSEAPAPAQVADDAEEVDWSSFDEAAPAGSASARKKADASLERREAELSVPAQGETAPVMPDRRSLGVSAAPSPRAEQVDKSRETGYSQMVEPASMPEETNGAGAREGFEPPPAAAPAESPRLMAVAGDEAAAESKVEAKPLSVTILREGDLPEDAVGGADTRIQVFRIEEGSEDWLEKSASAPTAAPRGDAVANEQVEKRVWDRVFTLQDGVWTQQGYAGEEPAILLRGSVKLADFDKAHEGMREALDLGDRVVFQLDGKWYRVEPAPQG